MSAYLENSTVATGLEKMNFHSSPKEGQSQRMFKLPHNYTHFTCQQSNAKNSLNQASTVCELRTFTCSGCIQKRQRNQRLNRQHPMDHRKKAKFQKPSTSASLTMLKPLTVEITTNCGKFFKRWEYQNTLPAS